MSKISQLPAANPLTGAETIPLVQNGQTRQAPYAEFADPIVAAASTAADTATTAAAVASASEAAALLYKQGAETAALPLPGIADDVAADRAATELAQAQAEAARDAAQQVVYDIVPIAQSALITANEVILIGNEASPAVGSTGVSIGFKAGKDNNSEKLTAVGHGAGWDYTGYAPALLGTFTARSTAVNNVAAVGTHAYQSVNEIGRVVHGFGAFAGGTVTFTGLPADGDTVTLNGVTFTARTTPATGYEFLIGGTATATAANLLAKVTAATDDELKDAMYRVGTGANNNRIEMIAAGRGAWGNAYTLATSSGAVALSAATFSGGTDHVNSTLQAGGAAMGFLAYAHADLGTGRPAHGWMTFTSNPADGDAVYIGNNSREFLFKTTPAGGTDIQIGADATATALNLLAYLRGMAAGDISVADYYLWPTTDGPRIYAVYKSNAGGTFRLRSKTSAIATTHSLFGAQTSMPEPSCAIGHDSGRYALGGESVLLGTSGYSLQGMSNFVCGRSAADNTITANSFLFTPNGAGRLRGEDLIAIGAGITNGEQGDWKQITGITPEGVITFAQRHGWQPGELIKASQRNTTNGSNLIKQDGANLSTAASVLALRVINSRQVEFYDGRTPELPQYVYSITGPPSEIEIARTVSDVSMSIALGRNSVLEPFTINIGSSAYTGGTKIRGGNLQNPDGGLQINAAPLVPKSPTSSVGPAAQGYVAITAVPSDGDTITANGTTFTFRTNPTGSNTDVAIGATIRECALNFLLVFLAYNPNITASRSHRDARIYVQRVSSSQHRINFICEAYSGDTYTLAASGAGLTVSGPTLTGSDMGTAPAPTSVPDGTIIRIQHHPKQNGRVGLAMADHANNRWQFL